MPSNEEDQNIYGEEELDEEESEEEDDDDDDEEDLTTHQLEDEEEEDLNFASPSNSSSSDENPNKDSSTLPVAKNPTAAAAAAVVAPTIAAAPIETPPAPENKRQRTVETSVAAEEKKPSAFDESRRLFQRLWTDEDEIGLLQGFLDFSTQRGTQNSSHHHDTGPFYDQIKTRLQLDFNKNQLVEKLRRLKKKYRNVVNRISSGKEFSFKSPHDQAAFEISRKIWSTASGGGVEESRLEEDEGNPQNINNITNNNDNENNNNGIDVSNSEKKVPRSRKRSRKRPAEEDNLTNHQAMPSIPNVVEDTVRSCLSPMFKELLYCAIKGPCNTGGYGGITMNLLPLNFGGNSMNFSTEVVDEKWRKQQILELEVYSKRIELVQDQIKTTLEELKSLGR